MENQPIDQMNNAQQTPAPAFTPEATSAQKKSGKLLLVLVVLVAIVLIAVAFFGDRTETEDTVPASTTEQEQTDDDLSSIEAELDATIFEGVSEGL